MRRYPRPAALFHVVALWLGLSLSGIGAAQSAGPDRGFDPEVFRQWVQMRVGSGKPVYWYAVGTVYSSPGGQPLMRMEGIDAGRLDTTQSTASKAHQLSRKTFVYRDLQSNAILREWQGKPLPPISYPYQYITYELRGSGVETWVEQGAGARVQRIGPGTDIMARRIGGTLAFSAPLFLDFPLRDGTRSQSFEHYDFFDQSAAKGLKHPYQISWLRFGDLPAGLGKGVMHMVSWRVDRFEDLPQSIREYVQSEAALWREPPRDMAEIRRLQQPSTP
ncbi:MAG: hypothetical protein ACKODA_08050 [Nevskiaceae bacterium]